MNFAFLVRSKTVSSLQLWASEWMGARPAPQIPGATTTNLVSRPAFPAGPRTVMPPIHAREQGKRLVRVVRVVEKGQHRMDVGRMVISGRMADVCAELDRLAAREATDGYTLSDSAALSY